MEEEQQKEFDQRMKMQQTEMKLKRKEMEEKNEQMENERKQLAQIQWTGEVRSKEEILSSRNSTINPMSLSWGYSSLTEVELSEHVDSVDSMDSVNMTISSEEPSVYEEKLLNKYHKETKAPLSIQQLRKFSSQLKRSDN